jgi:hypothetical protein
MMNRRNFLSAGAGTVALALTKPLFARKGRSSDLSHKERVDRALRGEDLDRPPFTFYHHYKRPTAQLEARDHLEFHRAYNTDIVKVMNDFDYPQSATGKWFELKPLDSPFPEQLTTLKLVRDGLNGDAYFVDTIYDPYMTAMILFQSQPQFAAQGKSEEVQNEQIKSLHDFQQQNPMPGTTRWKRSRSQPSTIYGIVRTLAPLERSSASSMLKVSSALSRSTSNIPAPMTSGSSMH